MQATVTVLLREPPAHSVWCTYLERGTLHGGWLGGRLCCGAAVVGGFRRRLVSDSLHASGLGLLSRQ